MILQLHSQVYELLVALRQILLQLRDGLRSTNACYYVLTLSIDQVLAENALGAGSGVTGKRNACSGGVALVSKYHGLYVNGSSPIAGNVVHTAVNDRSGVVPGTEYGLYGAHQLLLGILRELFAVHSFLVNSLEALSQLL